MYILAKTFDKLKRRDNKISIESVKKYSMVRPSPHLSHSTTMWVPFLYITTGTRYPVFATWHNSLCCGSLLCAYVTTMCHHVMLTNREKDIKKEQSSCDDGS